MVINGRRTSLQIFTLSSLSSRDVGNTGVQRQWQIGRRERSCSRVEIEVQDYVDHRNR